MRLLEYLSQSPQQTIFQLLQAYPERCSTEDLYISTHHANPEVVLKYIEQFAQHIPAQLSKIDGIRLDFEDGFGIIRASNTGEYFTVRFDADTPQRLAEIRQIFIVMLQKQYPNIAHDLSQAY